MQFYIIGRRLHDVHCKHVLAILCHRSVHTLTLVFSYSIPKRKCIYIYISRDSIAGLQELSEWVYVAPLHSKTHIWSAETFLTYLKFLEGEIRQRRKQLNLSLDDRCLILCDTACQHSSQKFKMLKDAWCEQHNVVLRLLFSVLHSLFPPISVSITFLCFPIQIYIYIHVHTYVYVYMYTHVFFVVTPWRHRDRSTIHTVPQGKVGKQP